MELRQVGFVQQSFLRCDDPLGDSHNSLNRLKTYFSQLLNIRNISIVNQIEIYTVEPLVFYPNPFEAEIAVAKLKNYKSPGDDQIPQN
jgi:hypothetical protein